MGRIPLLGQNLGNGPTYDPNDLFRFTANGRSLSASAAGVYFSIDGGATNLVNFNSGGGDKDDYKGDNPTDPFNASTGPNQAHALNSVDFTNLDVIGYDLITGQSAVPEPATITLLGIGLACGMVVRRCRRPRATPQ